MKRQFQIALIFLIGSALDAQVQAGPKLSLSMDAASYLPGSAATITVTLSGSAGTNIGAVVFDLQAQGVTFNAMNVQTSNAQPGKGYLCYNRSLQELYCVVIGDVAGTLTNLPLVDATLVTIPVVLGASFPPGVLTINISETDAVAPNSSGTDAIDVPTTGVGVSFPILPSPCDVNKDGKVDSADVALAAAALGMNQPGSITWVLKLQNVYRVFEAAMSGVCSISGTGD